jgi:anti-anti-sigma regulatory factor
MDRRANTGAIMLLELKRSIWSGSKKQDATIRLTGFVDDDLGLLSDAREALSEHRVAVVTLDLLNVEALSHGVLRQLVRLHETVGQYGGRLMLIGMNGRVLSTLRRERLDHLLGAAPLEMSSPMPAAAWA